MTLRTRFGALAASMFATMLFSLVTAAPQTHAATLISTIPVGINPTVMTATGTMLYVINQAGATVSAIDTTNNTNAVTSISVPGITSSSTIYAFGQKVYVSLPASNSVSIIDPTGGNAVTSIAMNAPQNFFGLGSKVYVTNSTSNTITAMDAITNATSSIVVGNHPLPITAIGSKLYVGNSADRSITIVDTANGNATTTVLLGGTQSPTLLKANGAMLYIESGGTYLLSFMDTANGNATSSVNVATTLTDVTYVGNVIYAISNASNTAITIDTANGNATTSIPVGAYPESIVAVGTKLYVSSLNTPAITVINSANGNATSTIVTPNNTQILLNQGVYLYASTVDNNVYAYDINTTAASITETTSIPATVDGSPQTYSYFLSYPVGEQESVHIAGCLSGVQIGAGAARNASTTVVVLSNYARGVSYHCTLTIVDQAGNASNVLNIGPFIWPAVIIAPLSSGRSSGTRHTVAQLAAMGISTAVVSASSTALIGASSSLSMQPSANRTGASASMSLLFTKNLMHGMTDPSVAILQHYLNTHGFSIATSGTGSLGHESTYFGARAQRALAAFQKAKGIVPASGYLGAVTRAYIGSHSHQL